MNTLSFRKKILAILLACIVAIAIGAVTYWELNEKAGAILVPSTAIVEPAIDSYIGNSSIYLILATSFYGPYPFASAVGPQPEASPVIKEGNPCFIINVTIRNDYTLENLPPNQVGTEYYANGTTTNEPSASVYVFLTARIYNKQGNVIQATDVTPPYGFNNGGAYASLQSGENATLSMYLATSQKDIDHFNIVLRYVGNIPLP
jgi:hypothetical protein